MTVEKPLRYVLAGIFIAYHEGYAFGRACHSGADGVTKTT